MNGYRSSRARKNEWSPATGGRRKRPHAPPRAGESVSPGGTAARPVVFRRRCSMRWGFMSGSIGPTDPIRIRPVHPTRGPTR
ncbi:hypothetical protein NL676_009639 [Syzygium grande]|nr:hypothetical protein NL676_009639 [Syzygium grande]